MITHKELALICSRSYNDITAVCGEVEVLIVDKGDCQILAHRGTEFLKHGGALDWVNNLRHLPPWYSKATGWVHPGYLKTVRASLPVIRKYLDIDLPIYVTGHSKGGGEAAIASKLLAAEGYNIKRCVTFGAPRAVMFWSQDRYNDNEFINYRNGSDLITTLPFKSFGYRHAGSIKQIGADFDAAKLSVKRHHFIAQYIDAMN